MEPTLISQASFLNPLEWHFSQITPNVKPRDDSSSKTQRGDQYNTTNDGRGPSSSVKMENPASANGSLSSTLEVPPQDLDTTDDASHRDPDTVRSRTSSSSSSSNSSCSSISFGDAFEARNRRFPPILPSTNRPGRFAIPKLTAQLASFASRTQVAGSSADESTSVSNDSSWEGGEEDSDGEDDDNYDEEEGEDDIEEEDGRNSRVQALWTKLRDKRSAVQQLRLELLEKRKHLKALRTKKNDADNRFMGVLRPYLVAGNGLPSPGNMIMRQFEAMQKERNGYHDKEAEVEQLEAKLDEEELSRETLETQFFTLLYGASTGSGRGEASPPGSIADSYAPPSRASLLGIPADRPVDIHPLYKQLLDAVGDRELAKEHHTELMMHRESILYDIQLNIKRERLRDVEGREDKVGALLDSHDLEVLAAIADDPSRLDELQPRYRSNVGREDEEFLREFPKEEAMLQERLKEMKDEVGRLRQLCKYKGFMRKNAPYHEEYTIFSDTGEFSAETMSINQDQTPRREEALANSRFPILLSNPRHVLEPEPLTPRGALRAATRLPNDDQTRPHLVAEAMKEYGIATLVVESAAEDKSDYINRWLLHRLRTSPLEVDYLYAIFTAKLKVRNTRRWQEDVLYYWSRDEANKPKEEYIGSVTTRDTLSIDDDLASVNVNSALGSQSQP